MTGVHLRDITNTIFLDFALECESPEHLLFLFMCYVFLCVCVFCRFFFFLMCIAVYVSGVALSCSNGGP